MRAHHRASRMRLERGEEGVMEGSRVEILLRHGLEMISELAS